MLTNSMRELTSPGAGELHFLPKLLVQEVASNCELELLLNRPLHSRFNSLFTYMSHSSHSVVVLCTL